MTLAGGDLIALGDAPLGGRATPAVLKSSTPSLVSSQTPTAHLPTPARHRLKSLCKRSRSTPNHGHLSFGASMTSTPLEARTGPIFAMPSPHVLKALAVWLTTRTWMHAGADRFGDSALLTPEGLIAFANVDDFVLQNVPLPSPISATPTKLRRLSATLVKDLRVAYRNTKANRASHADHALRKSIPFVWRHHDPFFKLGTHVARRAGAPLVQFVDAPHVWEGQQWGTDRPGWGKLYEWIGERPQLLSADLAVCVSDEVANAVDRIVRGRTRVIVAPCSADPDFFQPRDGSPTRIEFGFRRDDVVLGWSGSFRPFHAVDQLVDAFARAIDDLPQLRLLLVGDGPERSRIQQQVSALGLQNKVAFAGHIPFNAMPRFVAAMDIAVVTARDRASFHYSPLKLREYRAVGRPVVAPDVGQVSSTVVHAVDGLLYQPGNIKELSELIVSLGSDPLIRTRYGRAGQEHELRTGGAAGHIDLLFRELNR